MAVGGAGLRLSEAGGLEVTAGSLSVTDTLDVSRVAGIGTLTLGTPEAPDALRVGPAGTARCWAVGRSWPTRCWRRARSSAWAPPAAAAALTLTGSAAAFSGSLDVHGDLRCTSVGPAGSRRCGSAAPPERRP